MAVDQLKRKLAAILSADVKGYSRLMGEDEEWTLRTLNAYKELMGSLIQQHQGRIVGTAGDSVLAEFGSVVDAVQCAVEIQQVLKAKNAVLPETRKMDFRIGINLGDVIEEGDSIYGDGVNIAARLEALADPGGICISGSAYEQIENKIPLRYDYLGEHEVKNIAKPVRVYKAQIEPEAAPVQVPIAKIPVRSWSSRWVLVGAALVVIVGAITFYQFVFHSSARKMEVASKEKMAYPLPNQPSIAVLPFVNMSGDPKQEFLSDGITEEVITALSKVPGLLVIARNSTFTYKGKPIKVKQVSEELGVRYVLEGSVQRSAERIRINAQLIDALTGHHLWAERYDRDLTDLFALQDEIIINILTGVQVKLTGDGAVGSSKYFKGKQGLDCYFKIIEAGSYTNSWNIQNINMARRLAEETTAMCPENPFGYITLGWTYAIDYYVGNTKSPQETLEKAIELAQKGLAIDDSIPQGHSLLARVYLSKGEHDKAIAECERALALYPSGILVLQFYGVTLSVIGRPEEAIPYFQKAIRLSPFGPSNLYRDYSIALMGTGRFEEAVQALKKSIQLYPDDFMAHVFLAATFSMMGHEKEARAEAAEVLRINPKFSLDSMAKRMRLLDKYMEALHKAGLK
jgi:adenylate cyclase